MSLGDGGPFYMPSPDMFGHSDAYRMFTTYASELEAAGLADLFPSDADLRKITVELLAERYAAEDVGDDHDLIDEAVVEARTILLRRRS